MTGRGRIEPVADPAARDPEPPVGNGCFEWANLDHLAWPAMERHDSLAEFLLHLSFR
jgi:hypothetical protein